MNVVFSKFLYASLVLAATSSVVVAQTTPSASTQCIKDSKGSLVRADGTPCVNTIVTAMPFLRIVADARSGAMGDAGLATSADANSMHFNASKLVFADKDMGVGVTYTPWLRALGLNDVYLAYLSGYKAIDKRQAVGVSVRYFSLGQIDFTSESGQPEGSARPNEFEINVAYARKLSNEFSAGLGLKYIFSSLATGSTVGGNLIEPATGVAADISLTYKKAMMLNERKANLTVAGAITNIGPKVSYSNAAPIYKRDYIPTNLGLGGALEMQLDDFNSLMVTADVNKLLVPTPNRGIDEKGEKGIEDYREYSNIEGMLVSFGDAKNGGQEELSELMYSAGLEYWYDKQFAVRAGYYSEAATKGNRQFLTLGLGLKYNVFGLNFSYLVPTTQQRNPLDNTLRFSLLFDLGALRSDDAGVKNK
jgi:Type IX secretion system protein PorV